VRLEHRTRQIGELRDQPPTGALVVVQHTEGGLAREVVHDQPPLSPGASLQPSRHWTCRRARGSPARTAAPTALMKPRSALASVSAVAITDKSRDCFDRTSAIDAVA